MLKIYICLYKNILNYFIFQKHQELNFIKVHQGRLVSEEIYTSANNLSHKFHLSVKKHGEPFGCGVWGKASLVSYKSFNHLVNMESVYLFLDWKALLGDKSR